MNFIINFTIITSITIILELILQFIFTEMPVYKRHFLIFIYITLIQLSYNVSLCRQSLVKDNGIYLQLISSISGVIIGLMIVSIPWLISRQLNGISWQKGSNTRRDPSKMLILVADTHWKNNICSEFKKVSLQHPKADWLFLGDIFDIWIGTSKIKDGIEKEFLTWVDMTRQNGNWVGLWLGNREFFLDHLADKFDLIGEGIKGQLKNEGLYWEHGNLLNNKEWSYRIWHIISRSSFVWLLTIVLPQYLIEYIANRIHNKLHKNKKDCTTKFPQKDFQKIASKYVNGTFITGHFHIYYTINNGVVIPQITDGNFMIWHTQKISEINKISSND